MYCIQRSKHYHMPWDRRVALTSASTSSRKRKRMSREEEPSPRGHHHVSMASNNHKSSTTASYNTYSMSSHKASTLEDTSTLENRHRLSSTMATTTSTVYKSNSRSDTISTSTMLTTATISCTSEYASNTNRYSDWQTISQSMNERHRHVVNYESDDEDLYDELQIYNLNHETTCTYKCVENIYHY